MQPFQKSILKQWISTRWQNLVWLGAFPRQKCSNLFMTETAEFDLSGHLFKKFFLKIGSNQTNFSEYWLNPWNVYPEQIILWSQEIRWISDRNRNSNKQAYLDSTSIGNLPIISGHNFHGTEISLIQQR